MQFPCSCGKTLKVADNFAGKKIRCPACKEVVRVPEAEEEALEAVEVPRAKQKPKPRREQEQDRDDEEDSLPPRKKRRPEPEDDYQDDDDDRSRKKKADDDYDDDDRPSKKKKAKVAPSFLRQYGLYLGLGGGVAVAAAVVVVILLMNGGGGGKKGPVAQDKDNIADKDAGAKGKSNGGTTSKEEIIARRQSLNNLRQLALATHMYHDTMKGLPPADGVFNPELAGLSWRVHLLPYIDQNQLYQGLLKGQYSPAKPSEPWNRPELAKLGGLNLFDSPMAGKAKEPWHTFYRVFVGPGTAFEKGKQIRLGRDFPDSSAKTLMIVEAAEAVPWTKPEELEYDPAKPLPKLGGLWSDGFYGAFADGSVHFIPRNTDEKILRGYITRNGGEHVPLPDELPR